MLHADLADSPVASYRPDIEGAADSPLDHLRESISGFAGPLPTTRAAFLEICFDLCGRAISALDLGQAEPQVDRKRIVIETLRLIADEDTDTLNARAAAILKQLGADGRSDATIGRHYNLTRAAIQDYRRTFEDETGVRSRSSKSDAHREDCKRRRLGFRKTVAAVKPASPYLRAYHTLFRK